MHSMSCSARNIMSVCPVLESCMNLDMDRKVFHDEAVIFTDIED